MHNFKKFISLNIILILCSCGSIKEGFTNQKKNSTDEFLVEKKSPLIMPPSFGELPLPSNEKTSKKKQTNNVEFLINKRKKDEKLENVKSDNNFEKLILKKIKNN
tara:strand:- start:29 stop:343 length:315 start_codon:yes stop_codon:yes gene_type:complete